MNISYLGRNVCLHAKWLNSHKLLAIILCQRSAFGLAVTLTVDLWPWRALQQWWLTWWTFLSSFTEILPL